MCGRFTLTDPDPRLLRFRFELGETAKLDQGGPRFNVAPTDPVLAIRADREGGRRAGRLRWGLVPHYADPGSFKRMLINARAETVAEAPAFRDAFEKGFRCLIVADGFYEWKRPDDGGKQPVFISRPGRKPFAFAGLWAKAKAEPGADPLLSCTIITCAPGELIKPIHDRMPVILDPGSEAAWLDRETSVAEAASLLGPTNELEVIEVSDAVNNVRNDGPDLLEPPMKLF